MATKRESPSYNEENGTSYTTEALETSTDGAKSIAAQQAKCAAEGDQIVAFAHADFGHQFTAQFIRENGLQGKFANGGFDLVPGVLTAIENGEAQWTVGQNPVRAGLGDLGSDPHEAGERVRRPPTTSSALTW